MVLEVIYVVRHGYRSNWNVDPQTGTYSSNVRTPTGNPADPSLASYGVLQAEQLGTHLMTLDPAPNTLYSSPYYRCLQTIAPYTQHLAERDGASNVKVWLEPGLGEFYGSARFEHPSPSGLDELRKHFDYLCAEPKPIIAPHKFGESIPQLHDRLAYCLDRLIKRADEDPKGPKAILLCSHAAAIISIGRALTGRMPEEVGEEDFQCYTAGVSKFRRRKQAGSSSQKSKDWDPQYSDRVPDVGWRDGSGVAGGWDCELNSDCSFLENGEERGWFVPSCSPTSTFHHH
ncbi:histidine phosphatase superfamily [Neohortaea acidophila]|uniref:Histidine phosphatase superfamily n=1 Tax=Neohortaea acidophila TaxID=245834 RepID=A0A6A6Q0K4_9PEZI|nr:histidine phosphatase superfamily [Neohortaea acidophila]KAF2485509.1 histidine phosphatase superfamily [Neohortaea acidophila]